MAKRKAKRANTDFTHEKNIRALTALFILLLAFGVFSLFYTYQENILQSSSSYLFMVLTAVGFGFLVVLLYLVGKPHKN